MKKKSKKAISTAELTAGYEDFIKGKELNPSGSKLFNEVLKKAANTKPTKQRGLK